MAAVTSGDVRGLVELLAPDVMAIADGGGQVPAARMPITGANKVATYLARLASVAELAATTTWLNGMPGARFQVGADITAVSLVIEHDQITRIYAMRNPHKLHRLEQETELRR